MNKDMSETKVMLMKLFIRFLKENGVFKKFTINFNEYWEKKGNPKKICEYLEDKPSSYFLTGAFNWKDSNEGHNFWEYLSDDWVVIKNRILHKMKLVNE